MSGYPRERVIGSGTVLDTGRLKQLLGEELRVDSRNIHAFIIGEHGDSELAVWSEANVSGLALEDFCRIRGQALSRPDMDRLYRDFSSSPLRGISRISSNPPRPTTEGMLSARPSRPYCPCHG